jgi:hypothetical protein
MLSIGSRINSLYVKTPLFYKLYALTSGITYLYFPETLDTIIINTGCLVVSELLDVFEKYVKRYYPDKILLCDIVFFSNIVSKIGSLGYVSGNLSKLKALHTSIIGVGYSINSYLLQSIISGARYSAVWGTISSVAVWCGVRTFERMVKTSLADTIKLIKTECNNLTTTIITRVNTESDDLRNFVLNANSILSAPQTFLAQIGIEIENNTRSETRHVFLEDELDKLAPKRSPAFLNQMLQKSVQCSCCLDECTNKQFHRVLPCSHVFHVECIDRWLLEKTTVCPCCRTDLYPKYLGLANMVAVNSS